MKSLTYSDNELMSYGYDSASGWLLSQTTTPAGGSATTLVSNVVYSGAGGAAGHITAASLDAWTYGYTASYDLDTRLSSLSTAHSGATLFRSDRGYDAVGNVTAVNTTLSAGTDNQAYCYDEQNRLVWAGSTGTPSCGASLTPGSLTAANYTQSFSYDTLNRLTSGPLGSYSYGDTAHLDAATAIGTNTYTAKYDALGDMTCRAPSNTTTCSGTPTGATLAYDNEGRLSSWQDKPTSPTTTDNFLYDGSGNRVEQAVTVNGSITTTTTYVAGGLEESTTTGASTTLTKYFGAGGLPTMERVGTNGPLSVLASDGQGTVSTSLDSAGNVTSANLYTPYGVSRYSSGSSPTSHGYTGQLADTSTGLDYYHARYYDPVAGQFTSADTVDDGFNRYAYVRGNPTTATDPSGHRCETDDGECGNGSSSGGGSGSAPYLLGMKRGRPHIDNIRHADGTVTIITTTWEQYVWSDGSVTYGDETSSSQTVCDRECVRIHAMRKLDIEANNHWLRAILLGVLAAGVALAAGNTADAIVDAGYDVVELLAYIPLILGKIAYDKSGDAGAISQGLRITALIQGFVSMVEAFHAWWQTASWLVKAASTAAVWSLKVAGGGVIEGIKDVTLAMLGGAASLLLNSAAGGELAFYNAELAQENDQQNMDIDAWCAAYGQGACNGLTE